MIHPLDKEGSPNKIMMKYLISSKVFGYFKRKIKEHACSETTNAFGNKSSLLILVGFFWSWEQNNKKLQARLIVKTLTKTTWNHKQHPKLYSCSHWPSHPPEQLFPFWSLLAGIWTSENLRGFQVRSCFFQVFFLQFLGWNILSGKLPSPPAKTQSCSKPHVTSNGMRKKSQCSTKRGILNYSLFSPPYSSYFGKVSIRKSTSWDGQKTTRYSDIQYINWFTWGIPWLHQQVWFSQLLYFSDLPPQPGCCFCGKWWFRLGSANPKM